MERGPERRSRPRARAAALPGTRAVGGGFPAWGDWALGWIGARLAEEAEAGRPALWFPVAFGAGVAVYFAAAHEPELWATALLFGLGAASVALARRRFLTLGLALAFAAASGGFLAGKLATLRADAPALAFAQRAELQGRIETIEPRIRGQRRLTVLVERLGALAPEATPRRVRVTLPRAPALAAGDRVSLSAFWRPPQGPVRPGGYDFGRVAFFEGIGATGMQARDVRVLPAEVDPPLASRLWAALQRLRGRLTERITASVGGPEGTVAAALVTGMQGPIPDAVDRDLRAAGLAHILSISGLHMALVAGTLFWVTRAALALSQRAALRWPIKAISAAVALAGATFYLALSGAEVATQRSYLMIAIVFIAIMAGRPAVTPRNLAIAALTVLALTPEAMLGPSFQMSFAAVAALIAWFETRRDRPRDPAPPSAFGRALRFVAAASALALVTTLLAGLATAPFAAYHFHRMTPYALAGNALATPLISLLVMPSVVGGLLFAPLGLDGPWWAAMGLGLKGVLAIASAVASWPGSERFAPAFGEAALSLFAFGIVWLCLWRTALRWLGAPVLALALALAAWPAQPDVAIEPLGRSMAVRGPDGRLAIAGAPSGSFAAKVWLAADGDEPPPRAAPAGDVRCDSLGCVAPLLGGGVAALVWDLRAFEEDCRRATLVVTRLEAPKGCDETAVVIDRRTLAATGALSLTRDGAIFRGVAARDPSGRRPWHGPPPAQPPP
jgi:competence protein ComEC